MSVSGRVHVAAAALSGQGMLGAEGAIAAGAALRGIGSMSVGAADVAAAADELRVIRQPDVDKLAGRPPVSWSKQELVVNSLFLVAVIYWLLPPTEQQYLANMANLVLAVIAIVTFLKKL
jgi:hypothetical protein